MGKPCKECPFVKATSLAGAPDWLEDVMKLGMTGKDFTHSCHITDPDADGFRGGKKRECTGHVHMIMNEHDKTPGRGGVYNSYRELTETYLRHWLGNAKYEKMKRLRSQV